MVLQSRAPEYGARRHHTNAETGPCRLAPLLATAKNGGITHRAPRPSGQWLAVQECRHRLRLGPRPTQSLPSGCRILLCRIGLFFVFFTQFSLTLKHILS